MPGTTPLGLRYPLPWETVTAQSFQDLSEDIDMVLDTLDTLRTQARIPEMAGVGRAAGSTSVAQGVSTILTFDTEYYDTAALANLGVNNDRMTLSAGIWFVSAWADTTGVTTNSGTHLHILLNTVLNSFARIDDTSFTSHQLGAQALLYVPVGAAILQAQALWFGTGGPASWITFMQAWKVRQV